MDFIDFISWNQDKNRIFISNRTWDKIIEIDRNRRRYFLFLPVSKEEAVANANLFNHSSVSEKLSKHKAFRIISIFGGSASGKSSLAKALETYDSNKFSRVAVDRLIKKKQVDDQNYFIRPIEYDWEYLENLLLNTKLADYITLPAFDYSTFTRTSKISDKIFKVTEYLIYDAIEPYLEADFLFNIDTPVEIRKQRTLKRDKIKGINIMKNWDWNLLSDEYYKKKFGDKAVILDGTKSIEELKNILLKFIQ